MKYFILLIANLFYQVQSLPGIVFKQLGTYLEILHRPRVWLGLNLAFNGVRSSIKCAINPVINYLIGF